MKAGGARDRPPFLGRIVALKENLRKTGTREARSAPIDPGLGLWDVENESDPL
jgi:hypothetical protein